MQIIIFLILYFSFFSKKYSSNICGKVKDAKPINIIFKIALSKLYELLSRYNAIKEKIPVKMVKGKAFLTNNPNPLATLFGSSSMASEIECLIECKKQK